jgi:hypothetical protein
VARIERLLAIGAELITALREQYVAGDDPFLLLLHLVELRLLRCRLRSRLLQFRSLFFVGALRYAGTQHQRGERHNPRRGCQVNPHGMVSECGWDVGQTSPEPQP